MFGSSWRVFWQRKNRSVRFLYLVLGMIVLFTMMRSFFRGEYFNVFVCILTLGLFTIPNFVEKKLRLYFPDLFESLLLLFIFAAEILGEINCYYQRIPHWDTLLHCINGFMFAAFGFALFDVMNRREKPRFKASPFCLACTALCFSVTVGVLWEFFEFGCDAVLHTDMQKDTYVGEIYTVLLDEEKSNTVVSVRGMQTVTVACLDGEGESCEVVLDGYIDIGLIDTMEDMAVNFVGAFVFSILGYFHMRRRTRSGIVDRLIPKIAVTDE